MRNKVTTVSTINMMRYKGVVSVYQKLIRECRLNSGTTRRAPTSVNSGLVGVWRAKPEKQFLNCQYYAPILILGLLILSACTANPPDNDNLQVAEQPTLASVELPQSDWGTVELITQAEHRNAPVFIDTGLNTLVNWTGVQNDLARHFSRGIQGDTQILDIIAFFPQQQQLFSINRGALMLWLDRTNDALNLSLQAASISFDGIRMEGTSDVTTRRTRNYDAIALNQRQFRVVSSGGQGEITNLYLHHVDDLARPIGDELLVIDADYPALIKDNDDTVHLFWLSNNGRDAYHAYFEEIGDPILVNSQQIASNNNLAVTDSISGFKVAFDGTHAYLLWTVRHIDDKQEVWMSSGHLGDDTFSPAIHLMTDTDETLQWLEPASEIQSPLPMLAGINQDLQLLWMQNGEIQETEFITSGGHLIGSPHIVTTDERIGISWSQPTQDDYANLFYLSRPRNP